MVELLRADPQSVSSVLARVEVLRAVRRGGGRNAPLERAEEVLDRIALVRLDEGVVESATRLPPVELRALDAIHLATALSIQPPVAAVVTYDDRLVAAAAAAGLEVRTPLE